VFRRLAPFVAFEKMAPELAKIRKRQAAAAPAEKVPADKSAEAARTDA
jgi:hypothetical protein